MNKRKKKTFHNTNPVTIQNIATKYRFKRKVGISRLLISFIL